ncbi:WhiB family transcriptional regulator [Rhodococcoides kyotonense]|uniref:Transcriptional regulator WhiB n=1 Tax=Rhodococcoides kyotonense TaxID=398843 RepID=A0A177YKV1_9NOCA|nr:WhiB family transcriptional regulator [Rhodococcus kyotonensis]OAK56226.1 hypothetical protein A3K89_17270 [Rhodococcus kyotonensis]
MVSVSNNAGHEVGDATYWRDWARCKNLGSDLFFGSKEDQVGAEFAKALCRRCPVVAECLRFALLEHETFGIWGGMTPEERRWARLPCAHRWRKLRS